MRITADNIAIAVLDTCAAILLIFAFAQLFSKNKRRNT